MHFFVKIIPKELPRLTNEITVICTINTMRTEALPGGSHVACLNVKTSCVGVYKCLSLIVGFAITVTIWPREVVSCSDFILPTVTNFWATSCCDRSGRQIMEDYNGFDLGRWLYFAYTTRGS